METVGQVQTTECLELYFESLWKGCNKKNLKACEKILSKIQDNSKK